MIRNEREYRITKAQADKFRVAIEQASTSPPAKNVHPKLHTLSIDAMRVQLEDLDRQLHAYDELKGGKTKGKLRGRLEELGDLLVQARIARGWTQRELAEKLGLHMQKVQQYEATSYASASLTRILDVWRVLGADLTVEGKLVALPDMAAFTRKKVAR